jgi:drug/metabolite transporter (DMT)-like permease
MIYGLIAAAGWGLSSVAAAQAARRMGTLIALLVSQATGTIVLSAALAFMHPRLLTLPGPAVLGLIGAGALSLIGWLTYYRALEHGPVGIVSGAAATYGGVTALLALLVLGEPLGRFGGLGNALAVAGVAASAMQTTGGGSPGGGSLDGRSLDGRSLDGGARRGRHARPAPAWNRAWRGLVLALVSALTYGTGAFWLGAYAASAGWLVADLAVYIISVTVLLVALLCKQQVPQGSLVGMAWATAAGLAEAAALVAFARGGEAGQVALTAAVSSTYPVIPLAAGLLMFRERLSRFQVLGVCVTVTGLTLLGMSSRLV